MTAADLNRMLLRNALNRLITNKTLHTTMVLNFCRSNQTRTVTLSTSAAKSRVGGESGDLQQNDFYQKYMEKIKHLEKSNPEEYANRLKSLQDLRMKENECRTKDLTTPPTPTPSVPTSTMDFTQSTQANQKQWPPERLDDILHVDLVKDMTAQQIEQLWSSYHSQHDSLYSVIQADDFDTIIDVNKRFPTFVYPLPRQDGYEFIVSQFSAHHCYFTPLSSYQKYAETSQPILTLAHYPELKSTKGIVLMAGRYDRDRMGLQEAVNLARQMSTYHLSPPHTPMYDLLRQFNLQPQTFDYSQVIEHYRTMKGFLESTDINTKSKDAT